MGGSFATSDAERNPDLRPVRVAQRFEEVWDEARNLASDLPGWRIVEEDLARKVLVCERAGTFQTWNVPDLDGAAYAAANPGLEPNKGTIEPLDLLNPVALGDGLSTPVGGFCSAHWFDYHQSGIVAQGYYQQGLRLIDVRNARDLRQYGYVTGGASEVWDAYWVPQRDRKDRATAKKTNVIYTTDLVRGLDVYEVDLPGTEPQETTLPALP